VTRLVNGQAGAYAAGHLQRDRVVTDAGIAQLRCPLLGTRWLWFPVGDGPTSEPLPLLLRLPDESSEPTTFDDQLPSGFYL
jgi:hypothetical protein